MSSSQYQESNISYRFLGGGEEIGNVGILFENSSPHPLLIDYGLAPTNPPRYPITSPNVKTVILTHVHLDHVGMAPWLVSKWNSNLYCTSITAALLERMWRDTLKVSQLEGYPLIWDIRDLEDALDHLKIFIHEEWNVTENWKWRSHSAGHIPGASMIEIDVGPKTILVTGDYDTRDSPITFGAKSIETDVLFTEGTYGGREHPSRLVEESRFLAEIERIIANGGTILVPVFAVGRTQDILIILNRLSPEIEIHLDGMGKYVTEVMLEHPSFIRNPQELEMAYRRSRRVISKQDRRKAIERANVIVSTSGMLNGGPALWYLDRLRKDPRNAIFLTGYQAQGSGGRNLIEKSEIEIWNKITPIDLYVDIFDFSTHAGNQEIIDFASDSKASEIIIYHSEPQLSRPQLASQLRDNGHVVHEPMNDSVYRINLGQD